MKSGKIFFTIIVILATLISSKQTVARDAPITTIGSSGLCQAGTTSVAVTVDNFTNVSSVSLRIEYDPTVMTYSSFVPNSQLATMIVNDVHISASLHKIIVVWGEITPRTFANGTSLVSISFAYISGSTALTFNNTSNGGGDCEYADENGDPMVDTPTATFYMNGLVQSVQPQRSLNNITVASGQTVNYQATQTVSTAGGGTFFNVQSGGIATLMAGQNIALFPGTAVVSGASFRAMIANPCVTPNIYMENPTTDSGTDGAGVEEKSTTTDHSAILQVYPNPTSDDVNIISERLLDEVSVYNSMGSVVKQFRDIQKLDLRFDLHGLKPGIYLIRTVIGGESYVTRMVKW